MEAKPVTHQFGPCYDQRSRVLILGSIPSPKSREQGFYYGHPRNRFWRVMADVLGEPFPETVEARKAFLLRNRIALWDVLASCRIRGADDSSIREPIPNDLGLILQEAPIEAVFTTGKKAKELYDRMCRDRWGIEAFNLPSTSPANCACSYEKLLAEYGRVVEYL